MRKCEMVSKKGTQRRCGWGVRDVFIVMALAALMCIGYGNAYGFEIQTGNKDIKFNWDNTVRYTFATRVASVNDAIINNVNGDDGDRNFSSGILNNRFDLLSEADFIYKEDYGVRVSGAFWYDQAYESIDNDSLATSNHLEGGVQVFGLTEHAKNRFKGPDAELLDAFVFGKIELGGIPTYIKVGRTVTVFGESLLNLFNGISVAQMPYDLGKATALPGTEVKELFRPTMNVNFVTQINPQLQFTGQYFLEWQPNLFTAPGAYFGDSDLSYDGVGYLIAGPGVFFGHGADVRPNNQGSYGIGVRWSPIALGGDTIGFFYREFADRMPNIIISGSGTYHWSFPDKINLYGISYSTQIMGASVGAEISYRKHMPLNSDSAVIASDADLPQGGDILSARGETLHMLVNFITLLKKTKIWDAGTVIGEFDYSRWMSVENEHSALFLGRDGYSGWNRISKDAAVATVVFSPQWLEVIPGMDITVPLQVGMGLWGVGATAGSGAEGDGSWSIGMNFEFIKKYKINLLYVDYFGRLNIDPVTRVGSSQQAGSSAIVKDRDYFGVTLKTTF